MNSETKKNFFIIVPEWSEWTTVGSCGVCNGTGGLGTQPMARTCKNYPTPGNCTQQCPASEGDLSYASDGTETNTKLVTCTCPTSKIIYQYYLQF